MTATGGGTTTETTGGASGAPPCLHPVLPAWLPARPLAAAWPSPALCACPGLLLGSSANHVIDSSKLTPALHGTALNRTAFPVQVAAQGGRGPR